MAESGRLAVQCLASPLANALLKYRRPPSFSRTQIVFECSQFLGQVRAALAGVASHLDAAVASAMRRCYLIPERIGGGGR